MLFPSTDGSFVSAVPATSTSDFQDAKPDKIAPAPAPPCLPTHNPSGPLRGSSNVSESSISPKSSRGEQSSLEERASFDESGSSLKDKASPKESGGDDSLSVGALSLRDDASELCAIKTKRCSKPAPIP